MRRRGRETVDEAVKGRLMIEFVNKRLSRIILDII